MSRSVELVGNDGTRLDLMARPYELGASPSLWGMPPVSMQTDIVPGLTGVAFRSARMLERPVVVPLVIWASSALQLDEALARLARLINPVDRGPVRIVVTRSDGSSRELTVRYSSGLEAVRIRDRDRARVQVEIVFVAHHAVWRSVRENERTFEFDDFQTTEAKTPWNADLPWNSNIPWNGVTIRGSLFAPLSVVGDVVSWPRFEVTGPASSIQMFNMHPSVKLGWQFDAVLEDGQTLVVEMEPGRRIIAVDDEPAWEFMGLWNWWGLYQGTNHVAISLDSFEPSTAVRITYRDEWLTP